YFSPDGPDVDVYIDGGRILTNIVYKTVGTYQSLPAGSHKVEFRQTGSPTSSPALASVTTSLSAGAYYTAAAGGKAAGLTAVVFNDGFTPPAAGKAELRALHFAPRVPAAERGPGWAAWRLPTCRACSSSDWCWPSSGSCSGWSSGGLVRTGRACTSI